MAQPFAAREVEKICAETSPMPKNAMPVLANAQPRMSEP